MNVATIAFAAALAIAGAASAAGVDWSDAHQHGVIEILTTDPDGASRDTNVWVAALDGRGYVRTNDSRWFQNLMREPNAAIRFGDVVYPVRAELVRDAGDLAREIVHVSVVAAGVLPLVVRDERDALAWQLRGALGGAGLAIEAEDLAPSVACPDELLIHPEPHGLHLRRQRPHRWQILERRSAVRSRRLHGGCVDGCLELRRFFARGFFESGFLRFARRGLLCRGAALCRLINGLFFLRRLLHSPECIKLFYRYSTSVRRTNFSPRVTARAM